MKIPFTKYSCQGNDFVLIDHFQLSHLKKDDYTSTLIEALCHRKKGIGADGVLIMERSSRADFRMIYFNADGNEVEMCGNGSRAMVAHYFEHHHQGDKKEVSFETLNGLYNGAKGSGQVIKVQMTEFENIQEDLVKDYEKSFGAKKSFYLKVGVPHAIFEVADVHSVPLEKWGKQVRLDPRFPEGTNVNFFQVVGEAQLVMRTFERGVEAETLACGTGATAVAEVYREYYHNTPEVHLQLQGGPVVLEKDAQDQRFLCGSVSRVFEGVYFSQPMGLK